ncbi:MAG: ABC transporter permease [Acidobacteriota bacterium]
MRNVLAIAWREIRTYFASPLAYVIIGVFLALSGFFFWVSLWRFSDYCLRLGNNPYYLQQLNVNDWVIRPMFGTMGIVFLLMMPMVTMRLLAEERRTGTAELLFTCPVTSSEVVVGKYLGAVAMLVVMLGGTIAYPLLILASDARPDMKPTLVGYLGVLLMGLAFLSVGLLISSLTENQIVAAVGAFGVSLILYVIHFLEGSLTVTVGRVANRLTAGLWERVGLGLGGPSLGKVLARLSLLENIEDFQKGVLDTQHLVFYLSFIFMGLFLTQRAVESQRWR